MSTQRGSNGNGAGEGARAEARTGRGDGAQRAGRAAQGHGRMALGMPVEKAKDFRGTLRRLLGYLRPYSGQLTVVFAMAILSTVFAIFSPKVLGRATTVLFEGFVGRMQGVPGAGVDFGRIAEILWLLAGLYLVSGLFSYAQHYMMAGIAQRTVFALRKDIDAKLPKLPLSFYDGRAHGDTLSRVTNDIDTISNTLQQSLTQAITSIVTLVGVTIMMFSISPTLALVTMITLPLSAVLTANVARRSQVQFRAQQRSLGQLNGHVEEMYTGHEIVKAYGHEKRSMAAFAEVNEELYEAGWKAQFVSGLIMPFMRLINNIGYVFVSVVGALFVTRQVIAIGDVQAFIQYARQFSQPIVQIASVANIIQSTVAAAERAFELLDEDEETPDAVVDSTRSAAGQPGPGVRSALDGPMAPVVGREPAAEREPEAEQGHVRFENISFRYKPDVPLIDDLSIEGKPGQVVAIVGPTGAGKTTLVNLLMRFYDVDGGRITIDGTDIADLPRGALRSRFGMVMQDTWLFHGTIQDNIAYGREGATEEEVFAAARAAHADHFIRTLPDGYDTVLNEEASNISQGQKQLLTIARALLADPIILILDEATSSVDTRTELHIQRALHELMQGRTSFVIAHRLSTIRDADLVLVMNEGRIIEQGTHTELLEADGFYAELYRSQFVGAVIHEAG